MYVEPTAGMLALLRGFIMKDCRCGDAARGKNYQELFEKLDTNKDGKVDVAELRAGLIAMGIALRTGEAQVNKRPSQRNRSCDSQPAASYMV